MTTAPAAANGAAAESSTAVAAVAESLAIDPQAPQESSGAAPILCRSQGQHLLDRFTDQCNRIIQLHKRLLEVRANIVPGPPPSAALANEVDGPRPRGVAFFAGLSTLSDDSDVAIHALELDVDELAKLF
jgi:hypothetical protein